MKSGIELQEMKLNTAVVHFIR